MMEAEKDLVAKMLRAVLQSNKDGVVIERLQHEYNSLTGERIPFKKLGYPTLEAYLKSVPSVVRLENARGQVSCFAVVCKETEQIAKFVARQRSSKRRAGGQVNCQMRLKYTSPFMLFGKPKATLRQPGLANPYDMCIQRPAPALTRSKGFQWLSKPVLSPVLSPKSTILPPATGPFREVVAQKQECMTNKSERRISFTPQVPRDLHSQLFKNLNDNKNANTISQDKKSEHIDSFAVQNNIRQLLKKYSYGIWLSKLPHFYKEAYKKNLDEKMIGQLEQWPDVCTFERLSSGSHSDALIYPARSIQNLAKRSLQVDSNQYQAKVSIPPSLSSKPEILNKKSSMNGNGSLSSNPKEKLFELLQKYSSGLWVDALPKVFEQTYKERFPEDILQNLDLLSDSCTVDYISLNPKKAIIYAKSKINPSVGTKNEDLEPLIEQVHFKEENLDEIEPLPSIHSLIIPSEANPSVLVLELSNTNEVVIRYIGKDYSSAQDCVEDEMKEYYGQNSAESLTRSIRVGQMVAVNSEDNAWLRAQVISTDEEKIKVFYVDHGFTEMIERNQIRQLGRPFYSLPFQAAKCRLAGLEAFSTDPVILKAVETKACGKILAAEILERSEIPIVVLYDTSGDEDININSSCLKDLYDQSLQLRVTVDAFYTNVKVTNVCSDGTLFCQLPSKGLKKLGDILSKIEDCFRTKQVTSELFISLPFDGKMCLFYSKGKYARVEITSVHSCRAVDVQFLDSGTINTVKVSELKEIPPEFLKELLCIPPQVLKSCLADLPANISLWTPDAVLWLRDAVLNRADCSIKVVKIDASGGIVHVFLFTPKELLHPDCSINRQITNANLWKHQMDVFLSVNPVGGSLIKDKGDDTRVPGLASTGLRKELINPIKMPILENKIVPNTPELPPLLALPKPGEQMDVYVSVACHPGHFVFQSWHDLHLLEVVMEEMVLHYSTAEEHTIPVEKNKLYAAKVENKWYRVLLKGILTNGLVSVYELDYGKHELVSCRKIQPLTDKFKQLPFQAVTAQLAGVKCEQWSEEASIVFRNHVEKKPLVALVQSVVEAADPWNRKVVAYIVDTSLPDTDLWIHYIMSEFLPTFSAA